jgi:hypothetical protein
MLAAEEVVLVEPVPDPPLAAVELADGVVACVVFVLVGVVAAGVVAVGVVVVAVVVGEGVFFLLGLLVV